MSDTSCPTYVVALASLAAYRETPVRLLTEHFGADLVLFSGSPPYDRSIRLMRPTSEHHHEVTNRYLPGQVLLVNLPWPLLLRAPVVMLDLNPRVPHVWALLLARRALRRPTVLWGHAWPRQGRGARSEAIRGAMRRLADGLVTYTATQQQELRQLHPSIPVHCAPNATWSARCYVHDASSARSSVLCVGRLHRDKKPLLLVEAFERLTSTRPDLTLDIVGDGPKHDAVRERVRASPAADRIRLHGHVDDYDTLRRLHARAFASVCPGYAGLSLVMSLGFGVPVVVAREEAHAPEIEAVEEGRNALFFTSDDATELAEALSTVLTRRDLLATGEDIVADCSHRYSAEAMADGLIAALESAHPR